MRTLRDKYVAELLRAPVGDLTAMRAHAKLASLNDVIMDLNSIIVDEKVQAESIRRKGNK